MLSLESVTKTKKSIGIRGPNDDVQTSSLNHVKDPKKRLQEYYHSQIPKVTLSNRAQFSNFNDSPRLKVNSAMENIVTNEDVDTDSKLGLPMSEEQLWRSVFTCPLSGRTYDSERRHDGVMEDVIVTEDELGRAYFRTKKAAQESAAMAALDDLLQPLLSARMDPAWDNKKADVSGVPAKTEEKANEQAYEAHFAEDANFSSSSQEREPTVGYIERLYRLGVRSPASFRLEISEVIECTAKSSSCNRPHPPSRQNPTLLRCEISLLSDNNSITVSAAGPPCATKVDAIHSALTVLEQEISRGDTSSSCKSKDGKGETIRRGISLDTSDAKFVMKGLSRALSSTATYVYPLPRMFTTGVFGVRSAQSFDGCHSDHAFLYEVELLVIESDRHRKNGGKVAARGGEDRKWASKMGFDLEHVTPLGVLFPLDINPATFSSDLTNTEISPIPSFGGSQQQSKEATYEGVFELPNASDLKSEQVITTRLKKKGEVPMNEFTRERMTWISAFNANIVHWKMYGLGGKGYGRSSGHLLEEEQQPMPPLARTYMLVPLCCASANCTERESYRPEAANLIDFDLLGRLFRHEKMPYLRSRFNCSGSNGSPMSWALQAHILNRILPFTCLSAALAVAPSILSTFLYFIFSRNRHPYAHSSPSRGLGEHSFFGGEERKSAMLSSVAASAALAFLRYFLSPVRPPYLLLKHRFLMQRNSAKNALYVHAAVRTNSEETARPEFIVGKTKGKSEKVASTTVKVDSDMPHDGRGDRWREKLTDGGGTFRGNEKLTFAEFYKKRYGVSILRRCDPLIPVLAVRRHADFDASKILSCGLREDNDRNCAYIVPELIDVLPMPRDLVYLCQHVGKFMEPLERAVELSHLAERFRCLARATSSRMATLPKTGLLSMISVDAAKLSWRDEASFSSSSPSPSPPRSFQSLLAEAVQTTPFVSYQRLEFVGDNVLAFFTTINLFSMNFDLRWDAEEMGAHKDSAVKNVFLQNAALRTGVSKIVLAGRRRWISAASVGGEGRKLINDHHTAKLSDGVLSDVVESLMGALFLGDPLNDRSGVAVIAFLDELELPLPKERRCERLPLNGPSGHWFTAPGACVDRGYRFSLDQGWSTEIAAIGQIISADVDLFDRLDHGMETLSEIISTMSTSSILDTSFFDGEERELRNVLLMTSLFDDSLCSDEEGLQCPYAAEASLGYVEEAVGLVRVALLRDSLFVVGNAALSLCLSEEIFRLLPEATVGEMMLIRTAAISHDALAYLMVKNGIDECLFDDESHSLEKFRQEVMLADALGVDVGKEKGVEQGGWMLEGGANEYRRRLLNISRDASGIERIAITPSTIAPRYLGLVCGCLRGHRGRKLPTDLTDHLSFSLRAIVGALVVSLGTDRMWRCIFPLFAELLVLSPDEMRSEFSSLSVICQSYQKGKSKVLT